MWFFSTFACWTKPIHVDLLTGRRGQLWSPVEKYEEDAEQRRHGGRDETCGSSTLHRVLLEGGEKQTAYVGMKCKSKRVHVCVWVRAKPLGETGGRYLDASCASASSASRTWGIRYVKLKLRQQPVTRARSRSGFPFDVSAETNWSSRGESAVVMLSSAGEGWKNAEKPSWAVFEEFSSVA